MQNNTEHDFSSIGEVAQEGLCDFHLPPLASIVHIRASQVMDALPLGLGMSAQELDIQAAVRVAVETASVPDRLNETLSRSQKNMKQGGLWKCELNESRPDEC